MFDLMPTILARTFVMVPVFSHFSNDAQVVGMVGVLAPLDRFFENILPEHINGVEVVISDSCLNEYTFQIDGGKVTVLGRGDQHYQNFESEKYSFTLNKSVDSNEVSDFTVVDGCKYTVDLYPTQDFKDDYESDAPMIYSISVAVIFIFTAFVFLVYDWAVQLRQDKVLKTATRTQAIVSSLFPKNVQERIFKDAEEENDNEEHKTSRFRGNRTKDQLRNFLTDGNSKEEKENTFEKASSLKSKPIADLFPEATIIFAE